MMIKSYLHYLLLALFQILVVFVLLIAATRAAESSDKDIDELVRVGTTVRKQLEDEEETLETAFARLDRSIELINEHDFSGERLSIIEFRQVIRQLRNLVEPVIDDHQTAGRTATAFRKSLTKAQPILIASARQFAEFAEEEPYESLREDYLLWAESFEAIAKKYTRKRNEIGPTIEVVSQNLDYTRRTALLLERVERLLAVIPAEGPDNEAFLRRLASYIEAFNQLRARLNRFHHKTTAESSNYPDTTTDPGSSEQHETSDIAHNQFAVSSRGYSPLQFTSLHKAVPLPTFMQKGEVPVLNDPKLALEQSSSDLSGVWKLSGKVNLVIGLTRQSEDRYAIYLLESGMRELTDMTGEITTTPAAVALQRLTLHFSNGQSLDIDRGQLSKVGSDEMQLVSPVAVFQRPKGYGLSDHLVTTTLKRLH